MARIQQVVSNFTVNGQTGPWLKHDIYEPPFDMSLLVSFGTGLAATIAIDYLVDDFENDGYRQVNISQAATTITVTDNGPVCIPSQAGGGLGHMLLVGDVVELTNTPTTAAGNLDGLYAVASVISATVYTLTSIITQTLANAMATVWSGRVMQASSTDKLIPLAPVTSRATIGVTAPVFATRLHVTAFTTPGLAGLLAIQGGASS